MTHDHDATLTLQQRLDELCITLTGKAGTELSTVITADEFEEFIFVSFPEYEIVTAGLREWLVEQFEEALEKYADTADPYYDGFADAIDETLKHLDRHTTTAAEQEEPRDAE